MTGSPAPRAADPAVWWRLRKWPGRVFDLGVVLALLVVGAATVLTSTNEIPRLNAGQAPVIAVLLIPLASLLIRRRYPLVTYGIIVAAVVAESFLRSPILLQPLLLVAVYTVAARLPWRISLPLAAVALFAYASGVGASRGELGAAQIVSELIPVSAAYVVGIYVGTRVAYVDSLQARAAQLARERELLAQQAVAEERVRIARELHDVVAHHLSLITVQAGALQTQLNGDPDARKSAETIARTGRQAMDEMRRMLGVLRLGATDAPGRAPQPVIDEIPQLVQQARDAGLDVELVISGDRRAVPPGVNLSAYRIVQEALTNVLRHAGPAHCRVLIDYGQDVLELRITDDGRGATGPTGEWGHGLVGMRERVAIFGGDLFAGAVPGGGFAIRATLPLAAGAR
jgi:signal transduction histidine kinase